MAVKETMQLLTQLREQLQALDLWEGTPPSPELLKSTEPFAVDTLEFHQWLQFIMIPEFEHRIHNNIALPKGFAVSPMAEESWRGKWGERRALILTLRALDELHK
ncbi:hypothetical protein CWE15_04105 [Aliidiomarina taiwanensis]|uniref:YqcC-like domain-containing protein n=1 Tax=Aliidiomarina taiwanensis TaxID=946228 RepID=A0A432XAC2_9GAMM|nr:YqcC family protein [Aliidiomarina taiwanensis]RUO44365.1 hypothetical protein CWE15_04105 [Aliidiomarina taiwanensis]